MKNGIKSHLMADASIEEQHKIFQDKIDEFEQAVQAGKSTDEIDEIYKFLREYAKFHFKEEERIMSELNYPDLKIHVDLHDAFVQKLMEMKLNIDANGPTPELYVTMIEFMKKWRDEHDKGADGAFVLFMQTGERRGTIS